MFSFLDTNSNYFYWLWLIILIVRFFLNMHIYWQLEKETASSLYSPIGTNFEGTILYLFTFHFEILEKEDTEIKTLIVFVNYLHLFFIFYSVFSFILLLTTYGQ